MLKHYNKTDRVWVLSDLHLNHDKEFIWGARGFNNITEMNNTIIRNIKEKILPEDDFYICGDVALGPPDIELLKQIPGQIHVILGNHDTENRMQLYQELGWKVSLCEKVRCGKQWVLFTHYPTLTGNCDGSPLNQNVLNISGHTHSKDKWSAAIPFMYNASCEANNCAPILLSDIVDYVKKQLQ